jgi:hypothetical protein
MALKDRKLSTPSQLAEWIEAKTGIGLHKGRLSPSWSSVTKTRLADGSLVALTNRIMMATGPRKGFE